MKLRVIALDYDGTIATEGQLHPDVRDAIEKVRRRGLTVVLATGRILADLRELIGDLRLFDAIVAENGAVNIFPQSGRSSRRAPAYSPVLVESLKNQGINVRTGDCVVELDAGSAHHALKAIQELQLPLTLHFNRGRLMVLPQAVSKATGLRETLRAMRLSVHNTIAVGDAENDHELLIACEVGAAVSWGSPSLVQAADTVIEGDDPSAVARYIRTVAEQPRILFPTTERRRLLLGRDAKGAEVSLAVRGRNVLIVGDPRSGKSSIAGILCEQLALQGYCMCVLDPEGDYESLEALPGVTLLGGDDPPPSIKELVRSLRHPDVSVILDLVRLSNPEKRNYVVRALQALSELRRETGLPHRIVVDEAHYFLNEPESPLLLDHKLGGYTLITYRATDLHPAVLTTAECVVVTRETDATETRLLHKTWQSPERQQHWEDTLRDLEIDEAALLPCTAESGGELLRFRMAPRLTPHVRHRHKYVDIPTSESQAFYFVSEDGTSIAQAHSLRELIEILMETPTSSIDRHIRQNDFSRWIQNVFGDATLSTEVRAFEEQSASGSLPDFAGAVVHYVRERYRIDPQDAIPK